MERGIFMKQKIAILLCAVMVLSCCLLAACGGSKDLSDSKYVGTWKADSMSLLEEEETIEDEWLLTLNADGSAVFTGGGEDETENCSWHETSDGFKLTGDAEMTFEDDGDGIKTTVLGVDLHFSRQ